MSEQAGEKTEQATPRRLEEAFKKGQFARSAEIQTVFVLFACALALLFTSRELWRHLASAQISILGHLHDIPLTTTSIPGYFAAGSILFAKCAAPVLIAAALGGLIAGGIQTRFQIASEALSAKWERLNPVEGFKRLLSIRAAVATGFSLVKLSAIIALTYSEVRTILNDPIFHTSVSAAAIAGFLANSAFRIIVRIGLILLVIAVLDYAYQLWKTQRDLMMTRQEVKDEMKNSEGDPHVKARQRSRRTGFSKRKMLLEVPQADVIITNPTHLSIALRYDRKHMRAPRVIAKGSRLNALRIREIARQHQIPIMENKPLARLMFKHCKVGGEIPAELYAAVAEILAWVYRTNRYKYYAELNQSSAPAGTANN